MLISTNTFFLFLVGEKSLRYVTEFAFEIAFGLDLHMGERAFFDAESLEENTGIGTVFTRVTLGGS